MNTNKKARADKFKNLSVNSSPQKMPILNARGYRGRGSVYPATSTSTVGDWYELIFKKLLLGRVYGWKAGIGWAMVWVIVCVGGWHLTGSGWWFAALVCAGLVKFVLDVHEESADMKERMRERFGDSWDKDLPAAGYGYDGGYGGTGSVYDGVGGFGCSPHGFFGWEVPCAAAKADMELMGFSFGGKE